MVSIGTFSWASLRNIPVYPRTATFITISTIAIVVGTHHLALGVGAGVLLSTLCFAARIAKLLHISSHPRRRARRTRLLSPPRPALLRLDHGLRRRLISARKRGAWC